MINAEKFVFRHGHRQVFGPKVPDAGVEPLCKHVQAVLAHPEPTTISELQVFLGTINFYRQFLPVAARILEPLTDLLIGGQKGTEPVSLADPQQAAFVAAKHALATATCLAHPSKGYQLNLKVDTLISSSGCTRRTPSSLWVSFPESWTVHRSSTQLSMGSFWPVSRPSTTYISCWKGGRRFTLYTNHKPLTTALQKSTDPWTAKQCCQLAYIAEFTSDIQHIAHRRPPGFTSGDGKESPLRGTVHALQGDMAENKLSTTSGGLSTFRGGSGAVNGVLVTSVAVNYAALAAHQAASLLTQWAPLRRCSW